MPREAVMLLPPRSDAHALRRQPPAVSRVVKTPFVEGALALLWIALIVLLVPVVILLVGLPIAALLRLFVDAATWIVALFG